MAQSSAQGPGVLDYSEGGVAEALLVGFDIDSSTLHLLHKIWLDGHVVPALAAGGAVSLVGYASRTGADLRNLRLSAARAKAVQDYLRGRVGARGTITQPGGGMLVFSSAVGEYSAASDGVKDGQEDARYRTVHVKAWWKPVPLPPPTPKPKPPAPNKRVVTHRRWTKDNISMPNEPGETGADLADAFELVPDYGVSRHADVPGDHEINSVRDEFSVEWEMLINGSSTTYTREITYKWGPRAEKIHLLKQSRNVNRDLQWRLGQRGFYHRHEVWKHTIHPDEATNGV